MNAKSLKTSLALIFTLISVNTMANVVIVYNPDKITPDQVEEFGQECSSDEPGNFFYTDDLMEADEAVGQAVSNCIAKAMSGDPSVIASAVTTDQDVCNSVKRDGIGGFISAASQAEGACADLDSAEYVG